MSRSRYTSLVHNVERRQAAELAENLTELIGSLDSGVAPVAGSPVEQAKARRRVRRECNRQHKPVRFTAGL